MRNNKKPKILEKVIGHKEAKITPGVSYLDRKAAWQVNRVQMVSPYGWHELSLEKVNYIRGKLGEFEKLTWNEIFTVNGRRNHRLSVADLKCPKAKAWMQKNMPDQPYLWTLRLSGPERIWGILSEGIYLVVFWDPEHLIWETQK